MLREGHEKFKEDKYNREIAAIVHNYGIQTADLKSFIENIMSRMIFDGEKFTDLLALLGLSWNDRREKELALMGELPPQLKKLARGRKISGLAAYEQYKSITDHKL